WGSAGSLNDGAVLPKRCSQSGALTGESTCGGAKQNLPPSAGGDSVGCPPARQRLGQLGPMLVQMFRCRSQHPLAERGAYRRGIWPPGIQNEGVVELLRRDALQNRQRLLIGLLETSERRRDSAARSYRAIGVEHALPASQLLVEPNAAEVLGACLLDNHHK